MGEHRVRQRLSKTHLAQHPYCVYCGGATVASQVDHVPPKALFSLKHRPQGLEFSACEDCHEGTRKLDLIASVFSRLYPDSAGGPEREEAKRLLRDMITRLPRIAHDLASVHRPGERHIPKALQGRVAPDGGTITLPSSVRAALEAFGARTALALHYHQTGRALPETGAVAVAMITNTEALTVGLPPELAKVFQNPRALFQKGTNAHEEFVFDVAYAPKERVSGCFCTFRSSFAFYAFCAEDESIFSEGMRDDAYRPGFLSGLPI